MFTLRHYADHIETNIWLNAAEKLGWSINILFSNEVSLAEIKKGSNRYLIRRGGISANSSIASQTANDKTLTNKILSRHIPYVTQQEVIEAIDIDNETIKSLLSKYTKIVVKPIAENNGIGVTTSLTTLNDTREAIDRIISLGNSKVIVEKHVDVEKEYRIILWKGQVVDVLQRIPAYVVGNGTHTVRELIEQKNKQRSHTFDNYFKLITVDESLKAHLKRKGLTLDSKVAQDETVYVRDMCNLAQGGETKRISTDIIHPEYRDVFEKIWQATWLNYCGVDLMTSDISKKPEPSTSVINELNGAPALTVGFYADLTENRPLHGTTQMLGKIENNPLNFIG